MAVALIHIFGIFNRSKLGEQSSANKTLDLVRTSYEDTYGQSARQQLSHLGLRELTMKEEILLKDGQSTR